MASIARAWPEIKSYAASMGPGRGRPPRPSACTRRGCPPDRIWYDGWRLVFVTVLVEGQPLRLDDGLWVQRVACAGCWTSWTVRPAFLYPHRSYAPDVVEAASVSARARSITAANRGHQPADQQWRLQSHSCRCRSDQLSSRPGRGGVCFYFFEELPPLASRLNSLAQR